MPNDTGNDRASLQGAAAGPAAARSRPRAWGSMLRPLVLGVFALALPEALPADPDPIQTVYRAGVPHTDKNGNPLIRYDPEKSFFQIGVWGNPYGMFFGVDYDLTPLAEAGFNTMWPWCCHSLEDQLETGRTFGLQVVAMHETNPLDPDQAAAFKDHPNWLGVVFCDEPTGRFWGEKMAGKHEEFLAFKAEINAAAPGRPVFVSDVPWVTAPATDWWTTWNTAGDVVCHDNYPVMNRGHLPRTLGDPPGGIPTTVALAAAVNKEAKPNWLVVGAFSQRDHGDYPFRFPTPMQLRAQVYAGLIHGATGIVWFCWDTYVNRDSNVVGMSPAPRVAYLPGGPGQPKPSPVKPLELVESRASWLAATAINREIKELTPVLLSPTAPASVKYSLSTAGTPVTQAPVRCLLKPHADGGYVLLTVNVDDAVIKATFEFAGGLGAVQPMFEERQALELEPGQETFTDMYDPFEVHVYRLALQQDRR